MRKALQFLLLILGVVALVVLLADIVISIQATARTDRPVKVEQVKAGPYNLTVSLYKYPANAGYAFPFAIAPTQPVQGSLNYEVNSLPQPDVDATPVRASLSPDDNVVNGVQGAAEITVRGTWDLQIQVNGPQGKGTATLPIEASAPPAIPEWLGWFIGLAPLFGVLVFVMLLRRRRKPESAVTESVEDSLVVDTHVDSRVDSQV